jgi:uncharacterized protein (TIGR03382 family)
MQAKTIEKLAVTLTALTACAAPNEPTNPANTDHYDQIEVAQDGAPYYVRGAFGRVATPITSVADAGAMNSILPGIAAAFGVSATDLVATRVQRDELGMTHVFYAQRKNGLRVVGGDLVVHLTATGKVSSVNGTARDSADLAATPTVTPYHAAENARVATANGESVAGTPELTYVVNTRDGAMHLAWEVFVQGRQHLVKDLVYVDALSGRVVDRRPQIHTAKSREIHDGEGGLYPLFYSETVVGTEASPPTGDQVATAAFDNTGITHDCYKQLFNRDSYDNAGHKLVSLIHVSFFTLGGSTPNNAAWDSQNAQMVYGDGDGNMFIELAKALDVTAHELTHAVTSSTANLAYMNESGALNEAMSDIMAAVCESWKAGSISANTWLVGEDIFTPNTAGDALRYMDNPTKDKDLYPPELGGSRDFYPERFTGTEDQGGVHLNSGIANLAFQLLVEGGRHPRSKTTFTVPEIGMEKASKIFQRSLTQGYFTENTNFAMARTLTSQVANDLYPGSSEAVQIAWAAVGVGTHPNADTVPPTIDITAPTDGSTVTAGFTVDATAADDRGVDRVEFSVDGTMVGSDDTAPYSFVTNSSISTGNHTVSATAFDGFGNMASDSVTVTIPSIDPDPDPNPNNPDDGDGGGCCSTSTDEGAIGSLLLFLATMVSLRRRRR